MDVLFLLIVFFVIIGVVISAVVKVKNYFHNNFGKDARMKGVVEIVTEEVRRGKITEAEAEEKLKKAYRNIYG